MQKQEKTPPTGKKAQANLKESPEKVSGAMN